MATEYININNNSNGLTSISTISIKSLVNYVLDDLGYVDLNNEAKGDFKAAVEAYTALNDRTPEDTWAKLAKTRILTLQVEGKAE